MLANSHMHIEYNGDSPVEHFKQLRVVRARHGDTSVLELGVIFNKAHIIKCKDYKVKMKIKW